MRYVALVFCFAHFSCLTTIAIVDTKLRLYILLVAGLYNATGQEEEACPLILGCCEEDCCSTGSRWDNNRCVEDSTSGGFNGTYSSDYVHGCVERLCCDEACCGAGTEYDDSIQCCVPSTPTTPSPTPTAEECVTLDSAIEYNLTLTWGEECETCQECYDLTYSGECPDEPPEQGEDRELIDILTAAAACCAGWIAVQETIDEPTWIRDLPDCPCVQDESDPPPAGWHPPETGIQVDIYHTGAAHCMRNIVAANGINTGPGQQCCYTDDGRLITSGSAAGTPDRVAPSDTTSTTLHFCNDVAPWHSCPEDTYARYRPPNDGGKNNCPRNHLDRPWWCSIIPGLRA